MRGVVRLPVFYVRTCGCFDYELMVVRIGGMFSS